MRQKQSRIGAVAILGLLLLATTPVAMADGGASPVSYAFLPSWDGTMSGALDTSGESYLNGLEFTNHDFDDEGNLYFMESEDYGNWMAGQFTFSQRGFHMMKITPGGQVEYTETITCNNYCTNPDYAYSKVLGLHVVNEDQFYILLSSTNNYLNVGGQSYSTNQGSIVTAFYNNGTWSWVDVETSPSYTAYTYLVHHELDDSGNLYTVVANGNSGSWQEFSVSSFSPNGTNWVRTLELPYQSPTYNYFPPLFDVDSSGVHAMLTVPSQLKYDSQTIQCPAGGEEGVCHMWLSLSTAGVKTSAVGAPYTSVQFNRMQVHNGSMYLSGNTYDRVVGSHTESNFTGQKISHSPRYGQYVAVMEDDGSWGYHLVVNQLQNSYYNYGYLTDVLADGSLLFNALYPEAASVDSVGVTEYPNADLESILMRIHPDTGLAWSTSVGFTNPNTVPYTMRSDGLTVTFHVQDRSNGDIFYTYQNQPQNPSDNGSTDNYIFWVDVDDGQIVDIEPTSATSVHGRSPDGGVLAARTSWMYYYMPDFDGDNVGTGDNCPDNYNPDQLDYNTNGVGDACDEDDDSDGVVDTQDSCPRGETGWTSDELTDYDGDGCKDLGEEDLDDDGDGVPDITDACPVGIGGAGFDLDGDGCKDVEDSDDDGDQVRDESDLCSTGEIGWSSGTLTDHDGDGCQDMNPEDLDDDNDGIADEVDDCPKGAANWPSNINTDFDGDGCKDGFEDEDDDNDGISNAIDDCPRSIGVVNAQGCSATQSLDNEGGSSTVYYVCPVGSIVVLDPTDCPEDTSTNTQNNNSGSSDETFYYVCPGGSDVVTDLSECEGSIAQGGTNVTLVIDPSANNSGDYITCEGGTAIVLDRSNCPESITQDSASSTNSENSENGLMLLFMGGTFAMSALAMVVVLIRRPSQPTSSFVGLDETDRLFKEQPALPAATTPSSPPPSAQVGGATEQAKPSADLIGVSHDGKEWIEWPENSDNHYYRELGYGGAWTKYE